MVEEMVRTPAGLICSVLALLASGVHAAEQGRAPLLAQIEHRKAATECVVEWAQCAGSVDNELIGNLTCCSGLFCNTACQGCGPDIYGQCVSSPSPPPNPLSPPSPPSPPPAPPAPPPSPFPPLTAPYGEFQFLATSTAFGDAQITSCGGSKSAKKI